MSKAAHQLKMHAKEISLTCTASRQCYVSVGPSLLRRPDLIAHNWMDSSQNAIALAIQPMRFIACTSFRFLLNGVQLRGSPTDQTKTSKQRELIEITDCFLAEIPSHVDSHAMWVSTDRVHK